MASKITKLSNPAPKGALRLLQITDTHLYAAPCQTLAGINTLDSFEQVLDLALNFEQPADMVLATGDLVHDASEAGYRSLGQRFEKLGIPVFCLPGNHDESETLSHVLQQNTISTDKCTTWGNWVLVFLDSTKPGDPGGTLNDEELAFLDDCLKRHPDHHALICLHHHPVPIGSRWMDGMALDNPEAFFGIVDRYPGIKGILWGHIHQDYESELNGISLMGSPSTCIQFTPDEDDFKLDPLPPGFRWLELLPDGEIKTGIERIDTMPAGLKLSTGGY